MTTESARQILRYLPNEAHVVVSISSAVSSQNGATRNTPDLRRATAKNYALKERLDR